MEIRNLDKILVETDAFGCMKNDIVDNIFVVSLVIMHYKSNTIL